MTAAERSLRDALAKKRVIVVVGAGVTVAATENKETASWTGLLRHGIERVKSDCSPDGAWVRAVEELLSRNTPDDFLLVATMIKQELGHSYPHWLTDVFTGLTAVDDAVPQAVAGLGVPVATTNFDTVLEDVSGWSSATWRQPRHMHSIFRGDIAGIAHLHGVWKEPDSVVFDQDTYASVLRTDSAQLLQRVYAVSHSLFFVGVGDGGGDPNVGGLLRWLAEKEWLANPHYWLCRNCDVTRIRNAYPVETVPYGETYQDLAPFLRALAGPAAPDGLPTVTLSSPAVSPTELHELPPPDPWFVTQTSGPWSALTDGDAMRIVTADALGMRGLSDIAVVAEGSHLVALDDAGFRVWVLNPDGTLTEWPSTFPFDVAGTFIRSARWVEGNAIDVSLGGGPVPRVRLEARRPVVRALFDEDGTLGWPLHDHATGASVTIRATLRPTRPGQVTLSIRREQGTESADVSFETGLTAASRVMVARPLRGRTQPYAVVVEDAGSLTVWRWRDIAQMTTPVGARADHR